MATEDQQLSQAGQSLSAACAAWEAASSELYIAPGGPRRYSETTHAQRSAAGLAAADQVIAAAKEVASVTIETTNNALTDVTTGDPFSRMTGDEQTAASVRRGFIQEDAARLTPEALKIRMEGAIRSGDRADQYLLARYVGARIESSDRLFGAGKDLDLTPPQCRELAPLAAQLQDAARGPSYTTEVEALRDRLQRAIEVQQSAQRLFDEAHDTRGKRGAAMRASGRYSF